MGVARRDGRTLWQVAAMLVSLAALAERAGSRPLPVRWLVLSILVPAEALARALVAGVARSDLSPLEDTSAFEGSALDAARLAWRLRLLAHLLCAVLESSLVHGAGAAGRAAAPLRSAPRPRRLRAPRGPVPAFCDTS